MKRSPDSKASYDARTETIRTGSGHFVRIQELYRALSGLNHLYLNRIIREANIGRGVADPYEDPLSVVVRDITDLVRSLPQFCLPVVEAASAIEGIRPQFQRLLRDRAFGSTEQRYEGVHYEPAVSPSYDQKVSPFFYNNRRVDGEFSYFIRDDRRSATLTPDEELEDYTPYDTSFLIMRTNERRFFLRWPGRYPDYPAFYYEKTEAIFFFPHNELDRTVDFEELFPGYLYEVFGVQFRLPDLGTDYSYYLDNEDEAPSHHDPYAPAPIRDSDDRLFELLVILEAGDMVFNTRKELSKHYRKLSLKYHPLKHLHASEDEKEVIAARFTEITTAYNELKPYYS